MEIRLHGLGKRFGNEWIFRGAEAIIACGDQVAVIGSNGSGKSTFLQILCGAQSSSEGAISWQEGGSVCDSASIYKRLSFAAPYLEFPEELTFRELVRFHFCFKPTIDGLTVDELVAVSGLFSAADRPLRTFSSGMRQRVRLLLAFCSDVPLLVLDEPCSNLDKQSVEWYQDMYARFTRKRTVLVGSNLVQEEFFNCKKTLDLTAWKR